MEVSVLVAQMHDTLSTINSTIASLTTDEHDKRLDELEQRRDSTIQTLVAAFTAEAEAVEQQRLVERREIAERRRREDEERERRRRLEDEELEARERQQNEEMDNKLREETRGVEEETDDLMNQVESEAQRMIEEGKARLRALEERRKELNRLIDEQLKMPLPVVSTRARRGTRTGSFPPVVAAESKPSEVVPPVLAPVSNPAVKARECDARDESPAPAGRSRRGSTPELARFQAAVQRLKNIVSERPRAAEEESQPESPVAQRNTVEQEVQQDAPKPSAPVEVPAGTPPAVVKQDLVEDIASEPESIQEPPHPQALAVTNNVSIVPFAEPVFKEVQYDIAEVRASEGEDESDIESDAEEAQAREIVLTGLVKEIVLSPLLEEAEPTVETAPFPSLTEQHTATVAKESLDVEEDDFEFEDDEVEPSALGIVSPQRVKVARSIDDLVSKVAETAEVFSAADAMTEGQVQEPRTPIRQTRLDFEGPGSPPFLAEQVNASAERGDRIAAPEIAAGLSQRQHDEDHLEHSDHDEATEMHDHHQLQQMPTDWPLRRDAEEGHHSEFPGNGEQGGDRHLAPAPPLQAQLAPGGSTTDTASQVFVTPLASAGFRSPPIFEQPKALADELDDDGESHYDEDHHDYVSQVASQYQLQEEQATTVHGQDNLFDYDDNSDQSMGTRSHSPFPDHDLEHPAPPAPVLEKAAEVIPDDKEPTVLLSAVADTTKTDWASSTSDSPSTLATPSQIQPDTTNTTPLSPPLESPSAQKGLSASRHNPERPQTPPQQRPHSYATPDTDFQPRDVTHVPWHSRNTSTPQSLHSQSTLESTPSSSPVQTHSHHHDPVIRHSWSTGSGRQRGDSVLTQNSVPDTKEWRNREIAVEEIAPSTNTLFQRMRNVFEQPTTRERSASPVWSKTASESPSRKRTYEENDHEEEGDERSALLGSATR